MATSIAAGHLPRSERAPIPAEATWTEPTLAGAAGADVARAAMVTPLHRPSEPVTSAWGYWVVMPLERRL